MNLYGSPVDYFLAFLGGFFLSFTPCVYPLIPVSVSFIGVHSAGSKIRGLTLSLLYVSGLAVTYSLLGLLASLTGKIFGTVNTHPLTRLITGAIIIFFGIAMLKDFNLRLPPPKISPSFKRGYFSIFFLGLTSGLIISPCTTSVLASILAILVLKRNIFYGMTLLFTFAFGMGFILILAGTFSAFLLSLPKAGKWMSWIKRIGGGILIAMGVYFILKAF